MIPVKEAADLLKITRHRLKQILKEGDYEYTKLKNGFIQIPTATMHAILRDRGHSYQCVKVSIAMQKGGVGKTALTLNTGIGAARRGARVCIIDLDPEVCATRFLMSDSLHGHTDSLNSVIEVLEHDLRIVDNILPSRFDGVSFLPSKPKMRRVERMVGGKNPKYLLKNRMGGMEDVFDLILFDLPPAFNTIESSAYVTSDIVICPLDEDVFSIDSATMTIEDIVDVCKNFDVETPLIRILRNKTTPEGRLSHQDTFKELMREHAEKVLPFHFKDKAAIKNAINNGQSIFDLKGEVSVKEAFGELVTFVCPYFSQTVQH